MNETVNKVRLGYLGTPNDASYLTGTATWTSSDESIATVDANGNLIAWKPGTVTITMNYSAAIDTKTPPSIPRWAQNTSTSPVTSR